MTPLTHASVSALAALGDATPAEIAECIPVILGHGSGLSKDRLVAGWLTMTHHIPAHVALVHLDRWLDDPTSLGGVVTERALAMVTERTICDVRDALALEDAPEPVRTERVELHDLCCELGTDELRVLTAIAQDLRGSAGVSPAAMERPDVVDVLHGLCGGLRDGPIGWLLFVARRLRMGQDQYGCLDLASDVRDWEREAAEERADEAVYRACAEVKAGMRT